MKKSMAKLFMVLAIASWCNNTLALWGKDPEKDKSEPLFQGSVGNNPHVQDQRITVFNQERSRIHKVLVTANMRQPVDPRIGPSIILKDDFRGYECRAPKLRGSKDVEASKDPIVKANDEKQAAAALSVVTIFMNSKNPGAELSKLDPCTFDDPARLHHDVIGRLEGYEERLESVKNLLLVDGHNRFSVELMDIEFALKKTRELKEVLQQRGSEKSFGRYKANTDQSYVSSKAVMFGAGALAGGLVVFVLGRIG